MQEIRVRPHRLYRVSCWVKTEGLNPEGCFRFTILTKDGRYIAPFDPRVPATTDWRKVTVGFNSLQYDTVRIYAGCWGGRQGRFWVDDFRIEEIGMVNLLRAQAHRSPSAASAPGRFFGLASITLSRWMRNETGVSTMTVHRSSYSPTARQRG